MSEKIKNCFIDEIDGYEYDITYEGEAIAKAKTFSYNDNRKMAREVSKNQTANKDDILNGFDPIFYIDLALISWVFDKEKNYTNINLLNDAVRNEMLKQIMEHEKAVNEATEAIEKNSLKP